MSGQAFMFAAFWIGTAMPGLLCLEHAVATPESLPSISVRVYDFAVVPPSALTKAEAEARRIFLQAGIAVTWYDCSRAGKSNEDQAICSAPASPTKPTLKILRRFRLEPGITVETAGFAIPSIGFAYVSFERVTELMPYVKSPCGQLLGLVAAHEIGHLLLQTGGHSHVGIMHSPLSRKELGLADQNSLFTAQQASEMRESIWKNPYWTSRLVSTRPSTLADR